MKKNIIIITFFLIISVGCSNCRKSENIVLNFPKVDYFESQGFFTDLSSTNKKGYLLTMFDAHCSKCIVQMKEWESFLNDDKNLQKSFDLKFVVSALSKVDAEFAIDRSSFSHEVFLDIGYHFIDINDYLNPNNNTILIDRNGEVLFVGQFFHGDQINPCIRRELYD